MKNTTTLAKKWTANIKKQSQLDKTLQYVAIHFFDRGVLFNSPDNFLFCLFTQFHLFQPIKCHSNYIEEKYFICTGWWWCSLLPTLDASRAVYLFLCLYLHFHLYLYL